MSRDELLHYYERELDFLRRMGSEFAEKYPEVASRLLLEPTKCEDPHVERLIEACAMLAARVQMRLHDDFSEVTDALLGILYPHYLAPLPSMTVVQLDPDPEAGYPGEGLRIPRHSLLFSRPVGGTRCRFRTAYPVTLWPIEVEHTELVTAASLEARAPVDARSALRIRLRTQGEIPFSELQVEALRFFIDAPSGLVQRLYEIFVRDSRGLLLQEKPGGPSVVLPPECIRPVGFAREEGLLEYPEESFLGYRHIQEYFAFADKFLFVDLAGLAGAVRKIEGTRLDVSVLLGESLGELEVRPRPENLKLGCTPAVNLFTHHADPIRLTHTAVEYPVVPDARAPGAFEIYAIQSVTSNVPGSSAVREYLPFYAIRHGAAAADGETFWHASRSASIRKGDSGTEVALTFVDEKFQPLSPAEEVLSVEALCTNRDLPSQLPFGNPQGDFQLEGQAGVSRIRCLRNPTVPVRAPVGPGSRWRLVSHLALNHLSLSDELESGGRPARRSDGRALDALREILKLYDFLDSPVTRQRIAGLVGLETRRVVRRIGRGDLSGFARGLEVALELDPDQYTGSGMLLFASVLEAFLALYASVNSFVQTAARARGRDGDFKRWPPRAGEIQLL